jgi:hypothetical protein
MVAKLERFAPPTLLLATTAFGGKRKATTVVGKGSSAPSVEIRRWPQEQKCSVETGHSLRFVDGAS